MNMSTANAAISLDRTRAIINGNDKSISLNISNENKTLPYLAQGWIENVQGEKLMSHSLYTSVQR
ncbi:fimbria/pilus periplasmic chaperone [Providencia rettgeri]|nr:fimbria/pilus periplasmic chaperone [Providencia rettgeri]